MTFWMSCDSRYQLLREKVRSRGDHRVTANEKGARGPVGIGI